MSSKRPSKKVVKQKVAEILENLSDSEGDVAPQERFSAVGVDFGAEFTPAAATETEADEMEEAVPGAAPGTVAEETPTPPPAEAAGFADGEPHFGESSRKSIQGNIIPGFNKDYQHFLFYRLGERKAAKAWLRWIAPMISSMDEVLAFNRLYRVMRYRLAAKDIPIKATWVNIAFSHAAIAALTSKEDAEQFGEESFRQGLASRSLYLGDPNDPHDFVTPRYIHPSDPRAGLFAKPGQLLVWPGQFVLGMQRQSPERLRDPEQTGPQKNFPDWAAHGSYLVCRRLRQDVKSFWEFAVNTAESLGVPAQQFASMLVGRWPSGAPVLRTPTADVPELGADDLANNHFLFDDDTRPSHLIPIPGHPGDGHAQARADMLGTVCPHFAHIRKVNPRDSSTDLGKIADSLIRMILRRGIPFGPPVAGQKKPSPGLLKKERGLMFVCFQSSIEDQFEFLTRRWADSPVQPNVGGHDPIIGQEGGSHAGRERFIDFPKDGAFVRVPIKAEWVIPTGGGYFFAPPIEAIADVLGK